MIFSGKKLIIVAIAVITVFFVFIFD